MLLTSKFKGIPFQVKELLGFKAWGNDYQRQLVYMEYGAEHQSALNGVFSMMLLEKDDPLQVMGKEILIPSGTGTQYARPQLLRLPSKRVCAKTYIKTMDCRAKERETEEIPAFFLVAPNEELLQEWFYQRVYALTRTPLCPTSHHLAPEWRSFMWTLFAAKQWLRPVETIVGSLMGIFVRWNDMELRDEMKVRIKMKDATVMRFFEEGGDLRG